MLLDAPAVKVAKRIDAAAVGGELRHLLAGDDVADFAGFGLNRDGGGFDVDTFLCITDFQPNIDTSRSPTFREIPCCATLLNPGDSARRL